MKTYAYFNVLIVPSGIETKVIDATDWNLVVLIVPSGIETTRSIRLETT